METTSATDIARLIEWLRSHGHTDAEIVERLEYITEYVRKAHSFRCGTDSTFL